MGRRIVGRDHELASARAFLDAMVEGPAALVLEGPPGIGKTVLLGETADTAAARGWHLLSCRPAEPEAMLSYAGLGDLLGSVADETLAELGATHLAALEVALRRRNEPMASETVNQTVPAALLSVIRALAAGGPLLIAIDDAHWLDEASARAFAFAVRRLGELPVGVVVSVRTPRSGRFPLDVDRAVERTQHVRLEPLSMAALHHLVRDRYASQLSRPELSRVRDASGGNPLLALELARALLLAGSRLAPGDPLPIDGQLGEVMAARIAGMPVAARTFALMAATATFPTVGTLLALLGDVPWEDSGGPIAEAEGVIELGQGGAVRFTHPMLAAAAYAGATAAQRREAHRAWAAVVSDDEERSRHLGLAATEPDPETAAVLDAGARAAWLRAAPAAAADLAELALVLTPPDDHERHVARTSTLAQYFVEAGDVERARTILEAAMETDLDEGSRAIVLRTAAFIHGESGAWPAALALLQQVRSDDVIDPAAAAALQLDLAWAHGAAGDMETQATMAGTALASALDRGDHVTARCAAAAQLVAEFSLGAGVNDSLLELVDSVGLGEHEFEPLSSIALGAVGAVLLLADRFDAARSSLEAAFKHAAQLGSERRMATQRIMLAELECRAGHLRASLDHADEALHLSTFANNPAHIGLARATRARAAACLGHISDARADAEEGLRLGWEAGDLITIGIATTVLGFLAWSTGDAEATHRTLGPLAIAQRASQLRDPGYLAWVSDEIEALVALRDADAANDVLTWYDECAMKANRPDAIARVARCRAVLLASTGDIATAITLAAEAVAIHRTLPLPIELGRSLLVQGQVLRRGRQKSSARAALEEAIDRFDRLAMPLWLQRASDELARIGRPASARTTLTPTERRVAELAAQGLRNRDIASELFVSQRTVATNLSRAYQKLAIQRRAELHAALGEARAD